MIGLYLICGLMQVLTCNGSYAQPPYIFPVPGSEGLTGTFGEMRPNYYHFGLDIRVFSRWGVPIIAAADGYVSRARTFYNGYGKALYITHAGGYQTVYGHMERYFDRVENKMYDAQKKTRQFNQDIFFNPTEFRVRQGDTIGFSGSTGGSSGPHLHFEVRDPQERILNPMSYFREKLKDNLPPFISRICLEPLESSARINGQYDKLILMPAGVNSGNNLLYQTPGIISVKDKFGVEFTGYDRLPGAPNYNGVYSYTLYMDDQTIFECRWDRFHFDDSRYILQHTDYEFFHKYDGFLQKCYLDKGNKTPVYSSVLNKGKIELKDDLTHVLKLVVKDYHGNSAIWTGKVKRSGNIEKPNYTSWKAKIPPLTYEIKRNVVIFNQPAVAENLAAIEVFFSNGTSKKILPNYSLKGVHYTLLKLQPDLIPVKAINPSGGNVVFNIQKVVYPGQNTSFQVGEKVRGFLGGGCAFDTLYFEIDQKEPSINKNLGKEACSPVFTLGNAALPLFDAMAIRIFPDRKLDKYKNEQMVLLEIRPNGTTNRFGTNSGGATLARRMGKFALFGDTIPPILKAVNFQSGQKISVKKSRKLIFYCNDGVAEVDPFSIEAELDGKWELVEYYEYTHTMFLYLNKIPNGEHVLKLSISDYAGNKSTREYKFFLID